MRNTIKISTREQYNNIEQVCIIILTVQEGEEDEDMEEEQEVEAGEEEEEAEGDDAEHAARQV